MTKNSWRLLILLVIAAVSTMLGSAIGGSPKSLIIATATAGGTYYPVGAALATLIDVKLGPLANLTATAVHTAGSAENVQMLKNNECDLAILQGLYGAEAYHGKGPYRGKEMRRMAGVTMLWQNVEHFALLSRYVKTGTISDLKNLDEKFSIGKRGSGAEGSGMVILGALGIEAGKDFIPEHLGYDASVDAMQDGRIAGANLPAGVPVPAVTRMYSALDGQATVLNFTDEQLARVNGEVELWTRYVIPAGTYPGQNKPIDTVAQPNLLVASTSLDEETVYLVTKTLYENLPFLNEIHAATKAMSLRKAIAGMPMPLHPGAARYYREVGIPIPSRLLPKQK